MKRWALRIFVFLLLGAIVNVAVAWGAAWFIGARKTSTPMSPAVYVNDSNQEWDIQRISMFAVTRFSSLRRQVSGSWPHPSNRFAERLPSWTDWPAQLGDYSSGWHMVEACGFPMKTMRSRWIYKRWVSGLTLPARRPNPPGIILPGEQRALPLEIIWPGFAINTLFYAVILWLLFAAPFALRQRRRIKRGLCPACAYPVGDSVVCTECGAPLNKSAHTGSEL